MLSDNLEGWDGVEDGREAHGAEDLCVHTADSLCCTAETNTALLSNYTPIKNKLEKNPFCRVPFAT